MSDGKDWGVVINETALHSAAPDAANWWQILRQMFEASGTITVLQVGVIGDTVRIGPYTRDDAEFMCGHLIERGAPKSAVEVKRIPKQ